MGCIRQKIVVISLSLIFMFSNWCVRYITNLTKTLQRLFVLRIVNNFIMYSEYIFYINEKYKGTLKQENGEFRAIVLVK